MKYRIGNYICPRKVMSSDCVYDGKSSRLNYVSDTQETPIPKNNITPFKGITSDNAGHHHTYKVNRSGHVTIDYAYHPDLPEIKHKHHYVGKWPTGYVTRDKSSCYPCNMRNPKTKKRENGVYEHSHNLTEQINQGTGRMGSIVEALGSNNRASSRVIQDKISKMSPQQKHDFLMKEFGTTDENQIRIDLAAIFGNKAWQMTRPCSNGTQADCMCSASCGSFCNCGSYCFGGGNCSCYMLNPNDGINPAGCVQGTPCNAPCWEFAFFE